MGSGGDGVGADHIVSVLLVVEPDAEADSDVAERLAWQLRTELAELDVESVGSPSGVAPGGAKSADAVTVGAIVVALSASGGVFTALIETLRDWLGRQTARHRVSVTIDSDTIQLERATTEQQQALVNAYVRRHVGQQPR